MPMRKNESRMGMIFQKEKQMKKRRFPKLLFLLFLLLIVAGLIFGISQKERTVGDQKEKTGLEQMADAARAVFDQEPEQVKKLR